MKLRYFLFSLFIISGCTLYSQSVYELEYYFDTTNRRDEYKAFLYCNSDGTGFIRVKCLNRQTNADIVVHMDLQEDYGKDKNNNIEYDKKIFSGKNPQIIRGDTGFHYTPDRFWFIVNPDAGYFEPREVVKTWNEREYSGVVTQTHFIEIPELTQDFVLQYFTKEDGFFKNLFEPKARGGNTIRGAKLHLISVTNTLDSAIGKTCAIDNEATKKLFSTIATVLQIPFNAKEVTGAGFNKKNVLEAVNAIMPGENDIIVFYYSGHGFSKKNNSLLFPFLDLRTDYKKQKIADEELNIEEVYKMIKGKKGRVKLVLSDCCNWGETVRSIISPNIPGTRGSVLKLNPANCQALFMSPEPVSYLMTAASKGEVSAGTMSKGGFFTSQFRESLVKYTGMGNTEEFSWWDVINQAQAETMQIAQRVDCPQPDNNKIIKPCKQTPLYKKD
jgi:hypothetical protein